jgi:hypothetical protein
MSVAHSQPAVSLWSQRTAQSTLVRLLPLLALFLIFSVIDPGHAANGDEGPLISAAHRLLQGHYAVLGTKDGTQFLWHGPGLPALLAPLVALGVPVGGLRLTSPILMFASVLMFHRLLRLRLSPRAALIGTYALGLYGPAYYAIGTISKDPLALLLSICMLDGAARYLKHGGAHHAVIAALSFGALAMTRLEYGWVITAALVLGLAWWLAARVRNGQAPERTLSARRWTLVCALSMLVCLPWLIYTYSITAHPFYWGNSGGISLYWMASPSASQLGEWHASHTVFSSPALAAYRPLFGHLATLSPLQGDLELQHLAVAHALAHPTKYALNLVANVGRMFAGFPFPFTLPVVWVVGMIVINGALFAALLAAGLSLRRTRSPLPPETVPFLLFASLGLAVHLLPSAEPRMVLPLIPVPIWLIGQAFSRRVSRRASPAVVGPARAPRRILWMPAGASANVNPATDDPTGSPHGRTATTAALMRRTIRS